MTDCIYYDLDRISLDDIRLARARAPNAAEFMACGTIWPSDAEGPTPRELRNSRDLNYQKELMEWIDRLFAALERTSTSDDFCRRYGQSLLEIARYEFFSAFTTTEQRWRAVCEMRQPEGRHRLIWLAPSQLRGKLLGFEDTLPGQIEIVSASKSSRKPLDLRDALKRIARPPIKWLLARLAAIAKSSRRRNPSANGNTDVVLVEYFPNGAKVLIPIAKCLREQHGIEVVWIAARKSVRSLLGKYGVPSRLIDEEVRTDGRARNDHSRRIVQALDTALQQLPDELFAGTGDGNGRSYLMPAIRSQLSRTLSEAAYWLDTFHEAFGNLQPQCIVSTTYTSIVGRAAALAAHIRRRRSVYVQHGLMPPHRLFNYFCNDLVLVWGQKNRRCIKETGMEPDRVKVVGSAICDDLPRRDSVEVLQGTQRPNEPFRIAFMASRTGGAAINYSAAERCLSVVIDAVAQIPNAELTVKIHPADRTGMVDRFRQKRSEFRVVRDDDPWAVIRECDLVLVVSSTTGLEACAADKPLIALNVAGVAHFAPYSEYNAALEVAIDGPNAAVKLAEAIDALRHDRAHLAALAQGRRRLIDDMLNGASGDAAELAAKAIADILTAPVLTAEPSKTGR